MLAAADIGNIWSNEMEEMVMKLIMIVWILLILAVLYFLFQDFKKKILDKGKEE